MLFFSNEKQLFEDLKIDEKIKKKTWEELFPNRSPKLKIKPKPPNL